MNIKSTSRNLVEFAIKQANRKAGAPTFTFDELQDDVAVLEKGVQRSAEDRRVGTRAIISSKRDNAIARVVRGETGWWITSLQAR